MSKFKIGANRHALNYAMSLAYGHQDFVRRNTGQTNDAHNDHFLINPEGVLSNNRHFIADTMAEYQPNGDATTEGQSLLIIGYCHMYIATKHQMWLDAAVKAWEAYVTYYYANQPIPETAQRWICNWLVNGKEPVLADYPVHPTEPTHGGYKCVPITFTNGLGKIPHGVPFFGEYLNKFFSAHRGHPTWGAVNADVQKIKESEEGKIDWSKVPDFLIINPEKPYDVKAWVDWNTLLGDPSGYTPIWGGSASKGPLFEPDWIIAWTGNKIQDGEIIETGLSEADKGTVQLKDTTINGVYLVNYTSQVPVAQGGYQFARNEPWHNRPVHTPFKGSVNQMGNAADAEVWFIDCCYLLWRITGEERYKKALDCVFFTAHEYTYIDATDKFFRRSKLAETPFTDGISYDYNYPSTGTVDYSRNEDGDIVFKSAEALQHFMEQQAIRFRINTNSKLRVTYGGVCDNGDALACKVMVDINPVKADTQEVNWYGCTLPGSASMSVEQYDIDFHSLARITNPVTNDDYIIADARACSDYGGCTWKEKFEQNILDGRSGTVVEAVFPDDDAGFIIGFWLTDAGVAAPESIVYKADADFNFRFEDSDKWRWWWMLPATDGAWKQVTIDPAKATLSGYQPDHADTDPKPTAPNYTTIDQVTILPDSTVDNAHFSYYCLNDIPPVFDKDDGWTLTFRIVIRGSSAYTGLVGDCTVKDYRLDSLAYCPGTIPFSNIYSEGAAQLGAWHGMPYPGYQYPFMYTIHKDDRYADWLNNQITFMYDSQIAYNTQIGELGPGCAAYVWNRWDNYSYGDPDTWTTFHWGDGHPWAGYQPRAYNAAARCWYELVVRGKPVPEKLQTYVETWAMWLVQFLDKFDNHTPNEFPTKPNKPVWVENDFTAHMCALWIAGSCYAAMAGCKVEGLTRIMEMGMKEMGDNFTVTDIPGKAINGAWSPWANPTTDNGQAFGFYTGEAMRALGLYMLYKQHGAGYDFYRDLAVPDHTTASLDIDYVLPDDKLT
ncbi:TPA: phage tail protein [Salmonella enterica]